MSAQKAQNEIKIEEIESDSEQENIPEPEKIIPPTFYERLEDNLNFDLDQLIYITTLRYKLLRDVEYFSRKRYTFYKIIKNKIPPELSWTNEETIINDIASHFLLALAMCNTNKNMNWFINQESILYYNRIRNVKYGEPKYDMYKILLSLGMKLKLYNENQNNNNIDINKIKFRRKNSVNEKIYYVNFIEAINFIPSKLYYLHKGNIYILEKDLPKLFISVFKRNQHDVLSKLKKNSDKILKDRRIKEIILTLEKEKEKYNIQQAMKITKEINLDEKLQTMYDVDRYSERCFPLCMCLIERHLNKYYHLMHLGRLHYTLYLKAAGLSIDELLKFFYKKFEKKMTLEKFNKEYRYYFRHHYGLEGRKMNYHPYNCDKIINTNPPIGEECHGCPFKNYSGEKLKNLLSTCNLRDIDIEDILDKSNKGQYQMCCVKYFEGKFIGHSGEGIGIHPNSFFSSAMRILKGRDKNEGNKINNMNVIINKNNINENNQINNLEGKNDEEEQIDNSDEEEDKKIDIDILDLIDEEQ